MVRIRETIPYERNAAQGASHPAVYTRDRKGSKTTILGMTVLRPDNVPIPRARSPSDRRPWFMR